MDAKQRMAITGVGFVAAGVGVSLIGAALIAPAAIAWAMSAMEKGAERLGPNVERASKTLGTVAGTLQRSFREATKAGVAEIRRDPLSSSPNGADYVV
jgi:hypothetical protein